MTDEVVFMYAHMYNIWKYSCRFCLWRWNLVHQAVLPTFHKSLLYVFWSVRV